MMFESVGNSEQRRQRAQLAENPFSESGSEFDSQFDSQFGSELSEELALMDTQVVARNRQREQPTDMPTQVVARNEQREQPTDMPTQVVARSEQREQPADMPTQVVARNEEREQPTDMPTQVITRNERREQPADMPTQVVARSEQREQPAELPTQVVGRRKQREHLTEMPTQVVARSEQEAWMATHTSTGSSEHRKGASGEPRTLELIKFDHGKCSLQPEGASFLRGIPGQIAVVAVAGLSRTGKSFLLNHLLGTQKAFEVGPTINACTKGILVWGQPVKLRDDLHCVFMDTEGLGSGDTNTDDVKIFLLAVVLSSYLIYNSTGAIDREAFDNLHFVCELAKNMTMKEKDSSLRHFPELLWVLRDFHLKLPSNEKNYLEESLRPGQDMGDRSAQDAIRELFLARDCVVLPRPVAEENDLRNLSQLPFESLRPEFQQKASSLKKKVDLSVRPKLGIDGAPVTGEMLADLAHWYCKKLNSHEVPTIHAAWSDVVERQLARIHKGAVHSYRTRLNVLLEQIMDQHEIMKESTLMAEHETFKKEALAAFENQTLTDMSDPRLRGYQKDAKARMSQLLAHVLAKNADAAREACERKAVELCDAAIERIRRTPYAFVSHAQFEAEWKEVERRYLEEAPEFSEQAAVLQKVMAKRKDEGKLLRDRMEEARRADEAVRQLAIASDDARQAREDAAQARDETKHARDDARTAREDARRVEEHAERLEDDIDDLRNRLEQLREEREREQEQEQEQDALSSEWSGRPEEAEDPHQPLRLRKTWKACAGRSRGREGYVPGDLARTLWRKVRHKQARGDLRQSAS